jgi:branched-chain amino acid transport system substrate-binding protein
LAVCATVVAACGSSSTSSSSAASGPSGPILIGGIFTLSGANASSGENFRDGAQAAVNRINASGGVLNRQLQLIVQDSAGTPTGAAAAARALAQDNVVVMMGDNFSADVTAEAVVANEVKIPLLTSATANALFTPGANPYVYGVGENSSFTAQVDVNYMINVRHVSKPCVIEETGVFGQSTTEATTAALQTLGASLTATQQFAPGSTDVSVQLHALQSAGCDGVFVWAPSTPGIGAVARSMAAIGWQPPSATTQSAADAALVEAVGAANLTKFVGGPIPKLFLVAAQGDKPNSAIDQYLSDFANVYGSTNFSGHQLTAAYMYDAVKVISEAITSTNSTNPVTLRGNLESGASFQGLRTTYTWGPSKRIGESVSDLGVLQGGIPCVGPCVIAPTS